MRDGPNKVRLGWLLHSPYIGFTEILPDQSNFWLTLPPRQGEHFEVSLQKSLVC